MKIFDKYLEEIKLSGLPPLDYSAYRFDSTKAEGNFRADAGVGTCECCDYFVFDKCNNLILMEDTHLMTTIERGRKSIEEMLKRIPEEERSLFELPKKFMTNYVVKENVVKVYGSLFVLYKFLNEKFSCASSGTFQNIGFFRFWLVAVDVDEYNAKAWEYYKLEIRDGLRSRMGKDFIEEVELIPRDRLVDKLNSLT